jgi:prepilin-type N-terminal cleavage/methylation domain-containing protein
MKQRGNRFEETVTSGDSSVPGSLFPVPCSGFTLLELLISMTIVSLLATTVLFGWRIAASAWEKASTHLERARTVTETSHLLEEQMAFMVSYQVRTPAGSTELFFQGEPQTARFLSRYSLAGRSSSGLYRVEYQIADGPAATKQLWMNEFPVRSREELAPLFQGPDPASASRTMRFVPVERGPQTRLLLEGLTGCRFEYYKPAVATQPGAWMDHWPDRAMAANAELPRAMAIQIVVTGESADLKPVSIVAGIQNFSSERRLPTDED